jgi:hypothetical protein
MTTLARLGHNGNVDRLLDGADAVASFARPRLARRGL